MPGRAPGAPRERLAGEHADRLLRSTARGAWAPLTIAVVTVLAAHLPLIGLLITARPLIQNGHLSAGGVVGAVTYLVTGLDPALRSLVGIVGGWGVTLAVTLRRLAETIAPHPRRPRPPSALRPPRPISRPPPAPSRSAISCVCGA